MIILCWLVPEKICQKDKIWFKGCWPLKRGFQIFFRFLPDFQPIFRICQKIFDQRPKGHFHGLYMALLAFKGRFWEWSRVSRIQPSLWFWFGLSTWLYLKDKFWLPIYGTGVRSAKMVKKIIVLDILAHFWTNLNQISQFNFLKINLE